MRLGRRPTLQAGLDVHTLDGEPAAVHVNVDQVAILQGGERPADCRLRRDVANHQSLRRSREPPVGDHGHRSAESFADDCGCHLQHLAHAGSATRTFVSDDDGVARHDLPAIHRGKGVLFAIEHTRRPAVRCCRVLSDLHDCSIGREVAAQHHEPALGTQWSGKRCDDFLAGGLGHRLALLTKRAPSHGQRVSVDIAAFDKPPRQKRDAAGAVQLHRGKPPAWFEVTQQRGATADAVDIVDRQLHTDLAREGEQVKDRIGRPAARRHGRDRVVECAAREDARRPQAVVERVHDNAAHLLRG